MGTRTVHEPVREHICDPGVTRYPIPPDALYPGSSATVGLRPPGPQEHLDGTVIECDCGRTWVAYHEQNTGWLGTRYRPEGRFERWRRERRKAGS